MNYDQLSAFYYVSKVRSFTKASEFLNLTQPAITTRIRNLECELSCQLFEKQGKQLSLTQEGKVLLDYAEKIFFYSDEAKEALRSINQPQITIGFCPFSHDIIYKTVKDFMIANDIYLEIIEESDSISLIERVKKQKVDLAFVRTPISDSNLTFNYLFKDRTCMFVSPNHFLASKKVITRHDLEGQTLVRYFRNTMIWEIFEESLIGIKGLKKIEVKSIELLKKFVQEGLGFSIFPYFALIKEVQEEKLAIVDYKPLYDIPQSIMSVYYTGSSRMKLIKEFISHFKTQIDNDPLYVF